MASLTVKKADGTTDIVFDALAPAGADGQKAQWRQDTGAAAGLPTGHRATLTMSTVWNGNNTARRGVLEFKRPYAVLNSTTNRYESVSRTVGRLEMTLPSDIPPSEQNEAVSQFINCLDHATIVSALQAGFSPS